MQQVKSMIITPGRAPQLFLSGVDFTLIASGSDWLSPWLKDWALRADLGAVDGAVCWNRR